MVQKKNATAAPIKMEGVSVTIAPAPAKAAAKCTALTGRGGKGPRCTRDATVGQLCTQHNGLKTQAKATSPPAQAAAKCAAPTSGGKGPQCSRNATIGQLCTQHNGLKTQVTQKAIAASYPEVYANKMIRNLDDMTVPQLKTLCKGIDITGYSGMKKNELLEAVRNAPGGSMKWYYLTHADDDTDVGLTLNASALSEMATYYDIAGRSGMEKEDLRDEVASRLNRSPLADLRALANELDVPNNSKSKVAELRTAIAVKMFR